MKKSQVVTRAVFASVLSLTGAVSPLAYAVESDTSAGVVESVTVNDCFDRAIELLNSLEFEPSAEDSEKFTNLQESAAYATPEIMAQFGKVLNASFDTDHFTSLSAGQAAQFLAKFPMKPEVKTIAGLYTGEINPNELTAEEVASLLGYTDKAAILADVEEIAGLDEDIELGDDFSIDNPATWSENVTSLISALACYAIIANNEYNPHDGAHSASLQELADFYAIYDDVIASGEAQNTLKALEEGTHEDSAAYAYWKAYNTFMEALSADLSVEDLDVAINTFEAAAITAGAYVPTPEIITPVYTPVTVSTNFGEDYIISVSGEFPTEDITLEISPVELPAILDGHKQVVYDIVIRNTLTDEIVQPKAGTQATVTIDLPEDFDADRDIDVYHIDETETPSIIEDVTVADGTVTFNVEHFSKYALVQENAPVVEEALATAAPAVEAPNAGVVASTESNARLSTTTTIIASFIAAASAVVAMIARHFGRRED